MAETNGSARKIMIVTGGSGGIGTTICRAAAAAGYDVALTYNRDEAGARAIAGEIEAAGARALIVKGNLTQEADVMRLFEEVDGKLGTPDVLVNNAGISGKIGRVENMSAKELEEIFAINILGPFLCAREAVKRMSTKHGGRGGSIINVSSRASELGGAGEWVHYAASKGAIDSMTYGLARETASEGIRVNAVSPGLIATDIHANAGAPDRLTRLGPMVPIGRPGEPEEVAQVILWLASPAASYITAAIVPISGGR